MLTDMNAEPKDLEKFADIKAALSAQNLRRENERVAENAALNQRYAKKIQLLFPNLMESPDAGRVYLQRRQTAATMAGMYALSSTMSPELPCKSSDVKEVLVLLNRYSPASAQDYPPPKDFTEGKFEQTFTQEDLQTLMLITLQLTTVDFDEAWPSDTPWVQVNSQLQQMIGKQLEQNPNPKTIARALDVVYNLNAQESDPDQIDYLDHITKVICSKPKPKFDLKIMKNFTKIPLPEATVAARLVELNLPFLPEQLNATLKRYQNLASILGELAILSHGQTGSVKFHDILYELTAVGYPVEQMSPALQKFISELKSMQNRRIPSSQFLKAVESSNLSIQLPAGFTELVNRCSGKANTPLDETRQALQDILDQGLPNHLKTAGNVNEEEETTKFTRATQSIKAFLIKHPRVTITIPGSEVESALASFPTTPNTWPSAARDLHKAATSGDKTVEYFALKFRLKALGKAATTELTALLEKYSELMPQIPRSETQALIEAIPAQYRTEMASTFYAAMVGQESLPREEVLIALDSLPKPLPPQLAALAKEYSMLIPQRTRFTALLALTSDLANGEAGTADEQIRELLGMLSLDLNEAASDPDISSLDRSLAATTARIPTLVSQKSPPREHTPAERLLRLTHKILFNRAKADNLKAPDLTQLNEIWNLLNETRST